MSKALYRKYRPSKFTDVCGQDHVSLTLKNQIAAGKPSHAYLFTGSRGTGKTSSAKILAKAVNCLNLQDGDPCGECEMCKGIDSGAVVDVSEIDAASNNGVDNIRELRDNIAYLPVSAKYKVYIIDEVHMLSDGAFNALLKTLEEPPAHAIFILATTEVHKIPATILSRCQRYDFSRIPAGVIADRLQYICKEEKFTADENALKLIAKLADGGMRDAVSMLDLCAGISGNVTEQSVANAVGLIDKSYLFTIADLIEKQDTASLLAEIDRLYNASCDMERLCAELISHYRDLMVAKTTTSFRDLITATNEELEQIEAQSKTVKWSSMMNAAAALSECVKSMKSGTAKRIAVETTLIKLCSNSKAADSAEINALSAKIDMLEEKLNKLSIGGVTTTAVESTKPKAQPKPKTSTSKQSIDYSKAVKFTKWAEVMENLQSKSAMLYAALDKSSAYVIDELELLLIDAPNTMFKNMLRQDKSQADIIRLAASELTGTVYKIGPYASANEQKEKKTDVLSDFAKQNKDIVDER